MALLAAATFVVGVTPAFGHSCANLSMAAPKGWAPGDAPVFRGHWVWLPSIGVPVDAWGFDPPAGHQAQVGDALLSNSAQCKGMVTARQDDRGVINFACLA